ncbi:hypothetical protein QQG55_53820 [Brugia pahangi]
MFNTRRVGPLNSSTPKMKLSRTKSGNQLEVCSCNFICCLLFLRLFSWCLLTKAHGILFCPNNLPLCDLNFITSSPKMLQIYFTSDSFESNHTEPLSTFSPLGFSSSFAYGEQEVSSVFLTGLEKKRRCESLF